MRSNPVIYKIYALGDYAKRFPKNPTKLAGMKELKIRGEKGA